MDKKVSIQKCDIGKSSLFCGLLGKGRVDDYETPDLICLIDDKENMGEIITKQTCNTGGSDLSLDSSCSAGFSKNFKNEENDDIDVTVCRCSSGK